MSTIDELYAGELVTGVPTIGASTARDELVDRLVAAGTVRSPEVEAAFRAVPRHVFLPGVAVEAAYADDAVVTKRDKRGIAISSVSAPQIIAMMLEQLRVEPGQRVLEIGSGGYNAALLAELTGPRGSVTTIDIDHEVVDRARTGLAAAGYDRVSVLCGDGEFGAKESAPFDRIVVTVGAWDIPPAWTQQLTDGGRLVLPLRMRGLTRSVAFEREPDGQLASRAYGLCGFVAMQGMGECQERLVRLHDDGVGLRVDDGQQIDAEGLRHALTQPRVQAWSGVTAGVGERFDGLHLWLALAMPVFCVLAAKQDAVERGIVAHASALGIPAVVGEGSFAYLALRPVTPQRQQFEFGAYGHGPDAAVLADLMVDRIRSWDGSSLRARIEAYSAGTPDDHLPKGAFILDKRHTRIAISWP